MKMKKEIYKWSQIGLFSIALYSCGKTPIADVSYSPSAPIAGQTVQFTNNSQNAKSYSWNFGNMAIGKDENPMHVYDQPSEYIIDLTASSGLKSNTKTVTIIVGN